MGLDQLNGTLEAFLMAPVTDRALEPVADQSMKSFADRLTEATCGSPNGAILGR